MEVVVRESVTQFGPQRLQGKRCRKKAVSWCRAGPTFEDWEASTGYPVLR